MDNFFVNLPKIELHAHLNASLSENTVRALISRTANFGALQEGTFIDDGSTRTFKDSFEMFKITQQLTCSVEAVKFATKDVIEDFAVDGVCYLEIRSTPRSNVATGMSKRLYVDAVLQGMQEYVEENPGVIELGYLLSIDRRLGVKEAEDTVDLAIEYQALPNSRVLGIDFSGDATVGDARDYVQVFKKAKAAGLKLGIHMGEVRGLDDESLVLLTLPPDRIGHGTFLHENPKCVDIIKHNRIPFEVCLTSNVKCQTANSTSKEDHHMYIWKDWQHPVVVCTDGKGAFNTTTSKEYEIAAKECELERKQAFDFSRAAIDHIFSNEAVKSRLREKWDYWKQENKHYFSEI